MRTAIGALALLLALPGAVASVHLGALAIASMFYRERRGDGAVQRLRFMVIVPAHNEEAGIGRTIDAVNRAMRLGDHLLVVADRCTDATARVAREHGALVIERQPWEEPGRAATRRDGVRFAQTLDWDAVTMIDADATIEPGYFEACEAALTAGTEVVQVRGESLSGNGFWTKTAMAAFALQGLTIPRGRDRLGLSVRLRGPGLVMRRAIADRFPFRRARASEDLYLSLDLCLAGILPRHVDSARVVFRNAQTQQSASDQRIRWETGRMLAAREFVPRLLRRPTPARLEAAAHLLTPPVSMSMLSLATGAALAAACGWVLLVIGIGAVAIMLSAAVVTALVQVRASALTWLALAAAPVYVAWKSVVQVRAIAVVLRGRRDLAVHPTNGR